MSATGTLNSDSDTIVLAVNPTSRVDIEIPEGYAFPQPTPQGGHAGDGTNGGRAEVTARASPR